MISVSFFYLRNASFVKYEREGRSSEKERKKATAKTARAHTSPKLFGLFLRFFSLRLPFALFSFFACTLALSRVSLPLPPALAAAMGEGGGAGGDGDASAAATAAAAAAKKAADDAAAMPPPPPRLPAAAQQQQQPVKRYRRAELDEEEEEQARRAAALLEAGEE